jgi:hypothetical protein
MSPGIILAIGIATATALGVALVAVRRAGQEMGPEAGYGRELEAQPRSGRQRGAVSPGARQRLMLAIVIAAIAALGAGFATFLIQGPQ